MPTLGEELRRRREERGKSLSAISETTHIVTRFLKAIEEDNFSVLPGGIFTRSFIRQYAREVGMDEAEATALYHRQTSPQEVPEVPPAGPVSENLPETQAQEEPAASRPPATPSVGSRINWPTAATVLGMVV